MRQDRNTFNFVLEMDFQYQTRPIKCTSMPRFEAKFENFYFSSRTPTWRYIHMYYISRILSTKKFKTMKKKLYFINDLHSRHCSRLSAVGIPSISIVISTNDNYKSRSLFLLLHFPFSRQRRTRKKNLRRENDPNRGKIVHFA